MSNSLWPTYRLPASIEEAEDLVTGFLTTEKWAIDEVRLRNGTVRLLTRTKDRFFSLTPTRAEWQLTPTDDHTTVQLHLNLGPVTLTCAIIVLLALILLQEKYLLVGGDLTTIIPIGIGFALLLRWTIGSHCHPFFQAFRKTCYDAGKPLMIAHNGASVASPHALAPFLLAQFVIFIIMMAKPDAAIIRSTGFVQTLLPILALFGALLLSDQAEGMLRYRIPYVGSMLALIVYTAWPGLDDFTTNDEFHKTFSSLMFLLITLFTIIFLMVAARVLKQLATMGPHSGIPKPAPAHAGIGRGTIATGVLLLWAVAVYTQGTAVYTLIARVTSTRRAWALTYVWAAPLLAAYAALAFQR